MNKANLKLETKQMVTSVKTKSMSKLLEGAIDAEDCRKELDQKDRSGRTQAPASSTTKGKKKQEVFNIQTSKAPRKAQDPEDEVARKEEYKRRKSIKYSFNENVEEIFNTLLEHGKLELPPSKRPGQEAERMIQTTTPIIG